MSLAGIMMQCTQKIFCTAKLIVLTAFMTGSWKLASSELPSYLLCCALGYSECS